VGPAGVAVANGAEVILDRCIIAGSPQGAAIEVHDGSAELTCCDLFGNAGGDWVGYIESQYGVNGNISEDPLFCDPEGENFRLEVESPCAPFTPPNEECDLIGAWPVGCDPDAVPGGPEAVARLLLGPAKPNPFSEGTTIGYTIPPVGGEGAVLCIHDPAGRLVRTLTIASEARGRRRILWDGMDDDRRPVRSGVYFIQLRFGGESTTRSVVVIR
jgi:hypothetical protein